MIDNEKDNQAVTDNRPARRYRTSAMVILGLLILFASLAIVMTWIKDKPEPKIAKSLVEVTFSPATPVKLSDNLITIAANGFIRAKWSSRLTSQVSGHIEQLNPNLEVGEIIAANSVIMRVDKVDYQAALAAAESSLASAEVSLVTEQAQAKQARRDLKRAGVKATALAQRAPQLKQAKAAVSSAKAQVQQAKNNLKKTTITAPFDALVVSRAVALGENVNVGSEVATLASLQAFTVFIPLSTAEVALLSKLDETKMTVSDTISQKSWDTQQIRLDASIDSTNRTLGLYADIANPYGNRHNPLRLQSFISAIITGKTIPNSMWIANTAIVKNQFVWSITNENTLDKTAINIIYSQDGQSLVQFVTPIQRLANIPLSSFRIGKAVVTERKSATTQPESTVPKSDTQH